MIIINGSLANSKIYIVRTFNLLHVHLTYAKGCLQFKEGLERSCVKCLFRSHFKARFLYYRTAVHDTRSFQREVISLTCFKYMHQHAFKKEIISVISRQVLISECLALPNSVQKFQMCKNFLFFSCFILYSLFRQNTDPHH